MLRLHHLIPENCSFTQFCNRNCHVLSHFPLSLLLSHAHDLYISVILVPMVFVCIQSFQVTLLHFHFCNQQLSAHTWLFDRRQSWSVMVMVMVCYLFICLIVCTQAKKQRKKNTVRARERDFVHYFSRSIFSLFFLVLLFKFIWRFNLF